MAMYVKDGGDWRILDTSGDNPDQLYCRDSTSFTNKTVLNGYVKTGGAWKEFYNIFEITSFENLTSCSKRLYKNMSMKCKRSRTRAKNTVTKNAKHCLVEM